MALNLQELEKYFTRRGFLHPRLTTAQRLAIEFPVAGLKVYDKDLATYFYYDGTSWIQYPASATASEDLTSYTFQTNRRIPGSGTGFLKHGDFFTSFLAPMAPAGFFRGIHLMVDASDSKTYRCEFLKNPTGVLGALSVVGSMDFASVTSKEDDTFNTAITFGEYGVRIRRISGGGSSSFVNQSVTVILEHN